MDVGAWRRDASHTLATKRPPLPLRIKWHQFPNPPRVFPFHRSSFLPFASFPNNTNNSVRVPFASLSSSILFFPPLNPLHVNPSLYSLSVSHFLRFVYYYPRHRDPLVLYPLLTTAFSLPPFSPRTTRFRLPLSVRADSVRAISSRSRSALKYVA